LPVSPYNSNTLRFHCLGHVARITAPLRGADFLNSEIRASDARRQRGVRRGSGARQHRPSTRQTAARSWVPTVAFAPALPIHPQRRLALSTAILPLAASCWSRRSLRGACGGLGSSAASAFAVGRAGSAEKCPRKVSLNRSDFGTRTPETILLGKLLPVRIGMA